MKRSQPYIHRIEPPEQRFWRKVQKTEACWNWIGAKRRPDGYGYFAIRGKTNYPHRFSYSLIHGLIPKGLFIDHICRNRLCVNPEHLRAVTPKVNALENSNSLSAINFKKTHCIHGHEFTKLNTGTAGKPWYRRCKECDRIRHRVAYLRSQ